MVHTAEQPETTEPRRSRPAPDGGTAAPRHSVATAVGAPSPAASPTPAPAASSPTPVGDTQGPTDGGTPAASPAPSRAARPQRIGRTPRIRSASRRTRVVVRKLGPLSVLKFSLLFYLCLMLIVLFAMVIVYGILSAAGAIDSLEKLLGYVFGTGITPTGGAEPIEIDGGAVFMWGLFGGLAFVVIWSVINVFVAMLYNLISDIVGGVEVTLADRPN